MFFVLALVCIACKPCLATDRPDDLMSLITLSPATATPEKVTAVFGRPAKIEENNRKTWWHYIKGNVNLVVCWNKKSDALEKFSFTCEQPQKTAFDNALYRKLKSGATDIAAAVKLLGTPKDMTIKKMTQEMHYTYEKSVLRLFFRDKVLVDFTLLSQK
ncbi:MAG: hypothetical protein QM755_09140 [Luteolibacter sp.]